MRCLRIRGFAHFPFQHFSSILNLFWRTFFHRAWILCIKCSHPCVRQLFHFWILHHLSDATLISLLKFLILVFKRGLFWRSHSLHLGHLHPFANIWRQLKLFVGVNLICSLIQMIITTLLRANTRRHEIFVICFTHRSILLDLSRLLVV